MAARKKSLFDTFGFVADAFGAAAPTPKKQEQPAEPTEAEPETIDTTGVPVEENDP